MFVQEFYSSRVRVISYVIAVLLIIHSFVAFGLGFAYGGLAWFEASRRWKSWAYWRVFTQTIMFFAILTTWWLIQFPDVGWRYWVHMAVMLLVLAWHGIFLGWGISQFINCRDDSMCVGEDPIGNKPNFQTYPDWAWILLFVLVAVSFVFVLVYALFALYLRTRIEALLFVRNLMSPTPFISRTGIISGSPGFLGGEYQPVDQQEIDSDKYSAYVVDVRTGSGVFVPPDKLSWVQGSLAQMGDRNLCILPGPRVSGHYVFLPMVSFRQRARAPPQRNNEQLLDDYRHAAADTVPAAAAQGAPIRL